MKVALTHNARLPNAEPAQDAEHLAAPNGDDIDKADTVHAIHAAIEAAGHEVETLAVSGSLASLLTRLETAEPDIVFNLAEGTSGRIREAFYPALLDELCIPYAGSDALVIALTVDTWLAKLTVSRHGIDTPRAALVTPRDLDRALERGLGLAFPAVIKPNRAGSAAMAGHSASSTLVKEAKQLVPALKAALRKHPDGVLVEEDIDGVDVSVGYVDGVGHDGGLLLPVTSLPRDITARLRNTSAEVVRALGPRDLGQLDFRIAADGRMYFLKAHAQPSLSRGSCLLTRAAQQGLSYNAAIAAILHAAALRLNIATATELGLRPRRRKPAPIRVGFTYNVKRKDIAAGSDEQAEWDPPETIMAISSALERQGHIVVHLEATPDLPRLLAEADVDLIFNIAEGVEGRNRESQVPALCELLTIPYTGSDSATLAVALDKALCKKVLMQHGILTPKFQVMETGRERLSAELCFPLIVKPNAEGSSKGIANANVVDSEEALRAAVRGILDRYRQPAIIEEYIAGREFTVGVLGEKRPRVLPPMEIVFKDPTISRPVYDFVVKQAWEKHVSYECPAKLAPAELRAMEKLVRDTFSALDCRDVARVDLRMDQAGNIYVIEVNPLPGLTPNYSDLVLISQAAGMDYDQLMAEIMAGGLRRLRDKRREETGQSDKLAMASRLAAPWPRRPKVTAAPALYRPRSGRPGKAP